MGRPWKLFCFAITIVCFETITSVPVSSTTQKIQSQLLVEKIVVYPSNKNDNKNETNSEKLEGKEIIEKMTAEELKIRCQHLSRILSAGHTNFTRLVTKKPQETLRRPVYVHNKPTYVQNIRNISSKPSGFYITTQASSTTHKPIQTTSIRPQTTTLPVITTNNIKYIRLEPVILQKTILNDGRVLYYWHRSLPTAVEYPEKSTEEPTTTTTEYSPYLSFRNLLPFYGSPSKDETSTTTESQNLFNQFYKFVVPLPYGDGNIPTIRKPWDFDQYAYYPKEFQPNGVQLQFPYNPTFHVIKSVTVPRQVEKNDKIGG